MSYEIGLGLAIISRAEWELRYAAEMRKRTVCTDAEAADYARIAADVYVERSAGGGCGGASSFYNTPEDEAYEEISNWTDDGE